MILLEAQILTKYKNDKVREKKTLLKKWTLYSRIGVKVNKNYLHSSINEMDFFNL